MSTTDTTVNMYEFMSSFPHVVLVILRLVSIIIAAILMYGVAGWGLSSAVGSGLQHLTAHMSDYVRPNSRVNATIQHVVQYIIKVFFIGLAMWNVGRSLGYNMPLFAQMIIPISLSLPISSLIGTINARTNCVKDRGIREHTVIRFVNTGMLVFITEIHHSVVQGYPLTAATPTQTQDTTKDASLNIDTTRTLYIPWNHIDTAITEELESSKVDVCILERSVAPNGGA